MNTRLDLSSYYKHEDKLDTIILIFPGGGYSHLSARESRPVAEKFFSFGYDSVVINYPINFKSKKEVINYSQKYLDYFHKKYKNIFLLGFSAGGHLAGILSTMYKNRFINGLILAYPVVTLGKGTHEGSKNIFLGKESNKINIKKYSVENRINKYSSPLYIWTVDGDKTVNPKYNAYKLIEVYKKKNLEVIYNIYKHDIHGLALADETAIKDGNKLYVNKEVANWVKHAKDFIDGHLK